MTEGVICHGLIILLILENKSFLRATNFEDGLYDFLHAAQK